LSINQPSSFIHNQIHNNELLDVKELTDLVLADNDYNMIKLLKNQSQEALRRLSNWFSKLML
jgi:hypothetical protein